MVSAQAARSTRVPRPSSSSRMWSVRLWSVVQVYTCSHSVRVRVTILTLARAASSTSITVTREMLRASWSV